MFIHLHNHSHYSILEWLPKPAHYAKKAKEFWMTAVALTDTWNAHGLHEFYKACKAEWIKAILWAEVFIESSLDPKLEHKTVLLAKNFQWHKNIINIISKSNLDNPWKTPKISLDNIKKLKNSLWKDYDVDLEIICLSGPMTWEIPYYILCWKSDKEILAKIRDYQNIFWEENFFLELLYHDDIPKQKLITDKLIEINKKYSIPVVACQNCYYINKEDKVTQDIIKALWTWHELENPDRPTLINWDYSFASEEEMQMLFGFLPEALENTVKIAEMVNIKIETGWILIPNFELPEEHQKIYDEALEMEKEEDWIQKLSSEEWYLRYLSFKWLNWRFDYGFSKEEIFELIKKVPWKKLEKKLQETSPEELKALSLTYYTDKKKEFLKTLSEDKQKYIERLEYELVVIHEMWFDGYFLIVADYINWARDNEVPVWPWRWSAAWSVMAYLSGITDLDPTKYDLLFERFLNPARVSMPDIDTDFADNERDLVVDYCRRKYWADHVAQICTFWTFAARAAVKDVWRVMWIPFAEMNELAKLIPEKPWTKLKWALEDSLEFKQAYEKNPKYKNIIDNALKIEWNVRQLWVHACAVIIAPKSITNFTALQHPPKDENITVTQYSAYPLEDLWLLKMDFLWLRNLTIIKRALKIIKNHKNIDLDISKIPLDDKGVFDIFSAWDTTWVFQFESDWMRKYLKDLSPNRFDDLIAMVSLYRPWPLAYIPAYIERKFWREEIKYMTDDLKKILIEEWCNEEQIEEQRIMLEEDLRKILDVTYWIAVYQEQLMFIVQYMAWFSLWEADLLRRWIWKKKIEVIEELKKEFIEKWKNHRNYHPRVTRYIYEEMIQPAANYSFNKSHAACYAYISYQTAYLKAHFRTEFLTSVMVSDEESMERIVMEVWECESHWINVLAPSVNESLKHFTFIDDKNVRFGLKAIKWLWDWPIDKIIETRTLLKGWFVSLQDFVDRCPKEVINKKSLEALIKSWAMDDLWKRWEMWASIEEIIKYSRKGEKKKESNQIWLFDFDWTYEEKLELKKVIDFTFEEKLKWEKEMIGYSVSWHALDWLKKYSEKRSNNTKKLKMSFEELEKLEAPNHNPLFKGEEINQDVASPSPLSKGLGWGSKQEIVQAVWLIIDLRKVITKTGWYMTFLKCEWFDYDFEVVIFPKDYEKYADKLATDKIVIVNGALNINFEYKRKSIQAREIKIVTISQVREQARDLSLFCNTKRIVWISKPDLEEAQENVNITEANPITKSRDVSLKHFESLEQEHFEILEQKNLKENISEFIIKIPISAKKEDLHDLKEFLSTEEKWDTKIFIELKWQKVYTKSNIKNITNLENWIEKKW